MADRAGPITADSKTVTAAGTPEFLTTDSVPCSAVIVRAKDANTGVVYIVDSGDNTKKYPGAGLPAGETITLPIGNPAKIKIDVSVSAEGVDWLAV